MDLKMLSNAVQRDAAFRRRQRLQPAGGAHDKIFPPTYPGDGRNAPPRHIIEFRRAPGNRETATVLIDSVQSQANRLESALLAAVRAGLRLPLIEVDFTAFDLGGITQLTSLDASHRVFDAIFRDSELDGKPFMSSSIGLKLQSATTSDATALLEYAPTALVFGVWNSTGQGGGLGAKFARTLTSEIVGIDVPVEVVPRSEELRTTGRRPGSRIDALGILRRVEIYKGEAGWDINAKTAGAKAKKVRPSEINHGNITPSITPLGVTMEYAEQTVVISLAATRQLRFADPAIMSAAQAYLAALALLAVVEQDAYGYALRSRCDLVPEGLAAFELVRRDGTAESISLDAATARALYDEAYDAATAAGVRFNEEPVRLSPQLKLVEIIRRSRELALQGKGGEEPAEADSGADAGV